MPSWGIYEYYRREAEQLRTCEPRAAEARGQEVQPKPPENQLPDLMDVYRRTREYYDSGQHTR